MTTGLGQPEVVGKKSLFQPPSTTSAPPPTSARKALTKELPKKEEVTPRLRITSDLTKDAMETIQSLQHQHRLRTGKTLPAWKIISSALELYGKERKDEKHNRPASPNK